MKQKLSKILMAILIFLMFSYTFPSCFPENYTRAYYLLDRPDGTKQYKLNVAVPQSLYDYYVLQNHKQVSDEDFARAKSFYHRI